MESDRWTERVGGQGDLRETLSEWWTENTCTELSDGNDAIMVMWINRPHSIFTSIFFLTFYLGIMSNLQKSYTVKEFPNILADISVVNMFMCSVISSLPPHSPIYASAGMQISACLTLCLKLHSLVPRDLLPVLQ